MSANNNCNKSDAVNNLKGWGKRDTDDIISDDELFKQPPLNEDCPILLFLELNLVGNSEIV